MVSARDVQFYDPVVGHIPDFIGELPLPLIAKRFLKSFDDKRPVQPFTFEMPELVLPVSAIRFPKFCLRLRARASSPSSNLNPPSSL
jgi:hypothetical protein